MVGTTGDRKDLTRGPLEDMFRRASLFRRGLSHEGLELRPGPSSPSRLRREPFAALHDESRSKFRELHHPVRRKLHLTLGRVFRRRRHAGNLPAMSAETSSRIGISYRVLDAMDAPHSGRILRLRLQSGEAPSVRSLKGSQMSATSPEGVECRFRVLGFAVFGGKPSNDRFARTGRVDVQIEELDDNGPIGLQWEVVPD